MHTEVALAYVAQKCLDEEAALIAQHSPRVREMRALIAELERKEAVALEGLQHLRAERDEVALQIKKKRRDLAKLAVPTEGPTAIEGQSQAKELLAEVERLIERSIKLLSQPEVSDADRMLADSLRETAKEYRLHVGFRQRLGHDGQ